MSVAFSYTACLPLIGNADYAGFVAIKHRWTVHLRETETIPIYDEHTAKHDMENMS